MRIAAWSLLVGGATACGLFGLSTLWLIAPIVLVVLVQLGAHEAVRDRRIGRKRAREEPVDEWIVELDGIDLGLLADATFADMFWKTFTVVGSDARLFDESLWLQCRFQFRHAISGRQAEHAFCGGGRLPTPAEPRVMMRGLS